MSKLFEELEYAITPIGAISLRRRFEHALDVDVFEIKLGEEFLMSSLFTASEIALANLALAELSGDKLEIVVGGLGLGYTADTVLENSDVSSLLVIEMLQEVIDWHQRGLVPLGNKLATNPRCHISHSDFFELSGKDTGFDETIPGRKFDAILLDIDHSPESFLDDRSSNFYSSDSLRKLSNHLKPGGVFGLWSDDQPDSRITDVLHGAFVNARAEPVIFHNPLLHREFTQTVYLGFKG